ncbi:MAG: flagellar hook capping FlgD N-terminal domain-containing protein [Acidimicrobiales bacterium]|nr:flagellar hook capping FlgD N-terminal domain-containing protein [Acidimicrobiales bacterium]
MSFIPPVSPATPDNWGAPGREADKSSTEMDKDTFMKLLVAQLKYQDPLSPSDPQEFLAQTAQFTSVEKLEHIATQVSEQTWAMALSTAGGLVGQEITFLRTDGTTGTGVAGSATTDPEGIVLNVGDEQVPLGAISHIAPPGTEGDEPAPDQTSEEPETSTETTTDTTDTTTESASADEA